MAPSKVNKHPTFNDNFDIQRPLEHFEYDMNRTLVTEKPPKTSQKNYIKKLSTKTSIKWPKMSPKSYQRINQTKSCQKLPLCNECAKNWKSHGHPHCIIKMFCWIYRAKKSPFAFFFSECLLQHAVGRAKNIEQWLMFFRM